MKNSQIKFLTNQRLESLLYHIAQIISDVMNTDFYGALKSSEVLTADGLGLPVRTPVYRNAKALRHKLYYHGIGRYNSDECLSDAYSVKDVLSDERMRRLGFKKLDQTRVTNEV